MCKIDAIENGEISRIWEMGDLTKAFYYARHSWATIASKLGISKDVISHALGHGENDVTDVYIDFDLSKVDEANNRVVGAVQ